MYLLQYMFMYASVALPHWYDDRLEFPEKMLIYRTFRPVIVLIITNLSDTLHTLVINLSFFLLPRRTLVCTDTGCGVEICDVGISATLSSTTRHWSYNLSPELHTIRHRSYIPALEIHQITGATAHHWSFTPALE